MRFPLQSHREKERREADGPRANASTRTGIRPTALMWQVAKHGRQVTNIAVAHALNERTDKPRIRGVCYFYPAVIIM